MEPSEPFGSLRCALIMLQATNYSHGPLGEAFNDEASVTYLIGKVVHSNSPIVQSDVV